MNMRTYRIHLSRVESLKSALARLTERCGRKGLQAPTYSFGRRDERDIVTLTLDVHVPRYDGWALIGSLEHTEHGTIVRGHEVPNLNAGAVTDVVVRSTFDDDLS